MAFVLNEDEALKAILKGITVSDEANSKRPVGVFYGQPDKEIRQQAYPYIVIDLIDVDRAMDREHRGYVTTPYIPEGEDDVRKASYPIPVNLDYQITTYARYPRHDRQIIAALFQPGRLPMRFGQLYVPEDNTNRRVDFLGFTKRDMTEQDRRLFSNVYNIRVYSELFVDTLNNLHQVTSPNISLVQQTVDGPIVEHISATLETN